MHETTRPRCRHAAAVAALAGAAIAALGWGPGLAVADDPHAHHAAAAAPGKGITRAEVRYEVPDVELIDANGAKVSLRRELGSGQPVILNFIFTSCTAICPVMSATLSEVQSALAAQRHRVRIVSISIDPEYDSPARLKEYAARHRAGPDWLMLTGSRQAVLQVARAFDAWRGDKMNHTAATYLHAGVNRPWVRLDGFATPAEVVREVQRVVAAPVPAKGG